MYQKPPSQFVYKIKLLGYIGVFGLGIGQIYLKGARLAVFSLVVLVILILSGELVIISKSHQESQRALRPGFLQTDTSETHFFTYKEAQQELESWLTLSKQQPTHRDILFNIAQLYSVLGEENQTQFFIQQAKKTDPNNKLFHTNIKK